jgi:ABC-type lipoprotein export system ATPase subunit
MQTLSALNLTGSHETGSERICEVTLGFEPASLNLLYGSHGSGCNLLMRYLGLMARPGSGEVFLTGESTHGWTDAKCIEARSRHFGFVFETPLLIPSFNVAENVAMPFFKLTQASPDLAREATGRVLDHVGLSAAAEETVDSLPLWAQQRVALARALVTRPQALFVESIDGLFRDGELIEILELLAATRRTLGCCIIATATHSDVAHFATRAIERAEGRVVRDRQPGGFLS